jgi:predicted unusual protein kinase regulating ubiquinone biosynthesis (AarF/ABC1/UbiB family)
MMGSIEPSVRQELIPLTLIHIRNTAARLLPCCHRFYHADPHPGNLLKTRDGRLAYIDFGMMGSIEPSVRQGLIRATLHLVNREYELLAEDFVTLGFLPRGSDMDAVIPALTGRLSAVWLAG